MSVNGSERWSAASCGARRGEHLGLGARGGDARAEVAQRRQAALADDPLGVLADDAEHARDAPSSSASGL